MKQFEYAFSHCTLLALGAELRSMGKDGWQLIWKEKSPEGLLILTIMREIPNHEESNDLSKFTYEEMQAEINRRFLVAGNQLNQSINK